MGGILNIGKLGKFGKLQIFGGLSALPMWLMNGFSVTFFGRWREQCAYTLIYLQLPYMVINVQNGGGGHSELQKTQKVQKASNYFKGGREHKRPYCIS